MRDNTCVVIHSWMRSELKLTGNDLMVYAVIYGFSQDGDSRFTGSLQYLADWCGATKQGVQKNLKSLLERGLIEKHETIRNNLKYCEYGCTDHATELHTMQQSCNNNIDNNTIRNYTPYNSNSASSDKSTTYVTDEDEFDSHAYSPSELKSSFLGSAGKQKRHRGKSLYEKCEDEVYLYTRNLALQDELIKYLKFRLSMKDKPIYGLPQWQALLEKLGEVKGDKVKVVRQSIERGWASFFDFDTQKKSRGTNPDGKPRVDNQFGETSDMMSKRIDDLSDEERDDYSSGEGF